MSSLKAGATEIYPKIKYRTSQRCWKAVGIHPHQSDVTDRITISSLREKEVKSNVVRKAYKGTECVCDMKRQCLTVIP